MGLVEEVTRRLLLVCEGVSAHNVVVEDARLIVMFEVPSRRVPGCRDVYYVVEIRAVADGEERRLLTLIGEHVTSGVGGCIGDEYSVDVVECCSLDRLGFDHDIVRLFAEEVLARVFG